MDEKLSPREKALLEKYSGKGGKEWKKKAAKRLAEQFEGRYTEQRDPMPEDEGPGPEPDREETEGT